MECFVHNLAYRTSDGMGFIIITPHRKVKELIGIEWVTLIWNKCQYPSGQTRNHICHPFSRSAGYASVASSSGLIPLLKTDG
jgi:hypothetical protein